MGYVGEGGAQRFGHGGQTEGDDGFRLEGIGPLPVMKKAFAAVRDQRSFHIRPTFRKARKVDLKRGVWRAAGRSRPRAGDHEHLVERPAKGLGDLRGQHGPM